MQEAVRAIRDDEKVATMCANLAAALGWHFVQGQESGGRGGASALQQATAAMMEVAFEAMVDAKARLEQVMEYQGEVW